MAGQGHDIAGRGPVHRLYLLRHAKSSWDDKSLPDLDRPLSGRGRKAAKAMRRAIRAKGIRPDLILVSPSRRTRETLAALRHAPGGGVSVRDDLYLAPAGRIADILRGMNEDVRDILVIGHNPGMHELAVSLIDRGDPRAGSRAARRMMLAFPTGALAMFKLRCPWAKLGPGAGSPRRFIRPRDLAKT